jgi:hypothetical protein
MLINGIDFTLNDRITFETIHPDYNQTLTGIVRGTDCSQAVARAFTDVAAFHAETELTTDLPLGNYILIEHADGIRAWHPTWTTDAAKPGAGTISLTIYYADDTDLETMKALLTSNGYAYETND